MKILSKILYFAFSAFLALSLCACSGNNESAVELNNVSRLESVDEVVFSYKDEESSSSAEIKSGLYAFILSDKKTDFLYLLTQYNENMSTQITVNDTEKFWNTVPDKEDGRNYKQLVEQDIENYCKRLVITKVLCQKYGISVTKNTDTKTEIEEKVQAHINAYGDESSLNSYLYRFGITSEDLFEYYEMQYMVEALENYFYGSGGKTPVEESIVEKKFLEDYVKVKNIYISYTEPTSNDSNSSDSSSNEKNEFVFENGRTKEKVLQKANELLTSIKNGDVLFDDKYSMSEDNVAKYFPDGLILQKGTSDKAIDEAIFQMEVGEICLVEGTNGAYIILKQELLKSDIIEYYDDIEQIFIDERYADLIEEYYGFVSINDDELSKYDIITADLYNWK